MEWTFEDFDAELKDLIPDVRKKALEIAKKLMEEEKLTKEEAIEKAIARAEEWFFDREG